MVTSQRYRAEADGGEAIPPRQHKLRPLDSKERASTPQEQVPTPSTPSRIPPPSEPRPDGAPQRQRDGGGPRFTAPAVPPASSPSPKALKSALKRFQTNDDGFSSVNGARPAPPDGAPPVLPSPKSALKSALKSRPAPATPTHSPPLENEQVASRSSASNAVPYKSALKKKGTEAVTENCPELVVSAPVDTPLSDDSPETWSAKGICKRAFYVASQREEKERLMKESQEVPLRSKCPKLSRMSTHEAAVALNAGLLAASKKDSSEGVFNKQLKVQRSTSVLLHMDRDEDLQELICSPLEDTEAEAEAAAYGTEREKESTNSNKASTSSDTADTNQPSKTNPLKAVVTAKKVDPARLRVLLESTPNLEQWINAPLEVSADSPLPAPLFFAIGATMPRVVSLLLEFSADVNQTYDGKAYHSWIKPGTKPIEAVMNRRSRFLGTMLGDRLEEILEILKVAEERGEEPEKLQQRLTLLERQKREPKRSVKLDGALGLVVHTQGHPRERYKLLEELGKDNLSSVRMACCNETGKMCALKSEVKVEEALLWDEVAILRKSCHPNVIQLHETFEDEGHIYMVLQICEGGELLERICMADNLREQDFKRLSKQLASAIGYIHSKSICHRDIQPESFLLAEKGELNEATVKLIDFSTAKEFGPQTAMKTKVCTLHYVAPEILTRKPVPYTEKVDVWSLGVIFYIMLCGVPPFDAENEVGVLKKIKKGAFDFKPPEIWKGISQDAATLLRCMLVVDPKNRYSADQVLHHSWITTDMVDAQQTQSTLTTEQRLQLRTFHGQNRVQKAVLRMQMCRLNEDAVEALRRIFTDLDNGAGEVHISCIRDRMRRDPALSDGLEEIMRILWGLQHDGGLVRFDDFLGALDLRLRALLRDSCRAIFNAVDFERSGSISKTDVTVALGITSKSEAFRSSMKSVLGVNVAYLEEKLALERESYTFDQFVELVQTCLN